MMTLERALTLATGTDSGELNPLWREVVETLVKEIEKELTLDEVDRIFAENREDDRGEGDPIPALSAAILADMIDREADELADLAKEIDIYNGLKYEEAIKEIGTFKVALVLFAKQLREDANK